MTITNRIRQVTEKANQEWEKSKTQEGLDQIKQYLILTSPSLEDIKEKFEKEVKAEKEKPLSSYEDITEEEALKKISIRNSRYEFVNKNTPEQV